MAKTKKCFILILLPSLAVSVTKNRLAVKMAKSLRLMKFDCKISKYYQYGNGNCVYVLFMEIEF